ncbi:MAG: hypothetical protein R2932_29890 [Caldilineaceae bacterium]
MSAISTLGLTVATSTKEVRIMPPLYTGAILPVMRHLDHLFSSVESKQFSLQNYPPRQFSLNYNNGLYACHATWWSFGAQSSRPAYQIVTAV